MVVYRQLRMTNITTTASTTTAARTQQQPPPPPPPPPTATSNSRSKVYFNFINYAKSPATCKTYDTTNNCTLKCVSNHKVVHQVLPKLSRFYISFRPVRYWTIKGKWRTLYIYAVYLKKKRIIKLINSDTFYNHFHSFTWLCHDIRRRVGNVSTIFFICYSRKFWPY